MCGIIGYIGQNKVIPILLEGLKSLEYRGYDSAGVAVLEAGELVITRSQGKIAVLEEKIDGNFGNATVGIGHTRWATHGRPSDANSHPHVDCQGEIAVVHNGIIENYLELKEMLQEKGHRFTSETDTEVLPHLLEEYYEGNLLEAMTKAVAKIRGSYATVAICKHKPNMLVAARKDNPLVIGLGEGEYFFASDIPAIINHTRKIIILEDGEIAVLTAEGVVVFKDLKPVEKEIHLIDWDAEAAQKGGYDHFMLKEIFEQPVALGQTLKGRIADDHSKVELKELGVDAATLAQIKRIAIVACGTSYHAGLAGKYVIEKLLRLPVDVDIASEFRYRNPLVDEETLLIVISQSGETADTLAALREGKSKGAKTIAITNVLGSTISREADHVIYTWAGPEIAVASTKAYTTQLMAIYLLTIYLGQISNRLAPQLAHELIEQLFAMPKLVQTVLDTLNDKMKDLGTLFMNWQDAFFIGRSLDYAVALEGALKLKEISYIHAEAYAAGELKHGTLALIVEGIPVLALCTQNALVEKTISNIKEVKARDAHLIGLAFMGNTDVEKIVDDIIYIPQVADVLSPILTVIPLQLLAYYAAVSHGCDVDQPRNLAKSVTVE